MTTQAIDATIFASSHPDIAKRTSVSGLIFSCIMLLAGVIAFVSTFEMEDRSSTISMGLMVLGTALFLIGVFRLFWKSKEIVYLPTGSVAKEQSIFFDLKHLDELTDMVKSGDFSMQSTAKGGTSGNLRLDVMLKTKSLPPYNCSNLYPILITRLHPYVISRMVKQLLLPLSCLRQKDTDSNSSFNTKWGLVVDDGYSHFFHQEAGIHILRNSISELVGESQFVVSDVRFETIVVDIFGE